MGDSRALSSGMKRLGWMPHWYWHDSMEKTVTEVLAYGGSRWIRFRIGSLLLPISALLGCSEASTEGTLPGQPDARDDATPTEAGGQDVVAWDSPPETSSPEDGPPCSYGGESYEWDGRFTGPHGCRCRCGGNGKVTCSTHSCDTSSNLSCDYYGTFYQPDTSWQCADGCNTCTCGGLQAGWGMSTMGCLGGEPCEKGGKYYRPGIELPADDGCNWCICWPTGEWSCTTSWVCIDG